MQPRNSAARPTESQLTNLLQEYQLISFKKQFGFDYQGDRTDPSDKATQRKVSGYAQVLVIKDDNWKELRSIIEQEIFS